MFIGHFAVGLASKAVAPRTSAGALIMAPMFLDLLWPFFLVTGAESVRVDPGNTAFTPLDLHDFPWSHSLVMAVVWSLLFGGVYFAATRYGRGAAVLGLLVFSHWVLDLVTHRPDLPLYPGSATSLGLGLWSSRVGTVLVEMSLFAAGVWVYARVTRPRDRTGQVAFWAMVALLAAFYVANYFSPPPPSAQVVAWSAFLLWLFAPWARWFDRHRDPSAATGDRSIDRLAAAR